MTILLICNIIMFEMNIKAISWGVEMSANERKSKIVQLLEVKGKIDIVELSEELSVTPMTIRRDLDALEKQKKLIRTHGGAVLPQLLIQEQSFESKLGKAIDKKRMVAHEAVSFIEEHMTILLDSGTTNFEIAKLLKHKKHLTVVTNDITIAVELMNTQHEVIVLGGRLQNGVGAVYGPLTEQTLNELHVDAFFLGAHAVHPTYGVTTPSLEKAALKKAMINAANNVYLVVDSTKLDYKSFSKVCDLHSTTKLITDFHVTDEQVTEYEQYTDLVIAKKV
ncbi:DeoR/GlpR family DNA-binding transcription regulator [Chungangia koreensis]